MPYAELGLANYHSAIQRTQVLWVKLTQAFDQHMEGNGDRYLDPQGCGADDRRRATKKLRRISVPTAGIP
jgi:hypothetical protein